MQQQNENQNSPIDGLERLLDAALKRYAAVQPREGLEGRILARMRSQSAEPVSYAPWRWLAAAAAVAALAVIISMALRPHARLQRAFEQHSSVALPARTVAATAQPKLPKRRFHAAAHTQVATALPKLDQFPSPQPLSEQEKLLASYVAVYPKQAALLAKLRTEELERERIEEQSMSASKDAADFDQE